MGSRTAWQGGIGRQTTKTTSSRASTSKGTPNRRWAYEAAKRLEWAAVCHFNANIAMRNGLQVVAFVFRVPSEDVFNKFREQTNEIFNFTNREREHDTNFDDSPSHLQGMASVTVDASNRLREMGRINQVPARSNGEGN